MQFNLVLLLFKAGHYSRATFIELSIN